jgi:hypothetical protein
VYRPFSNPHFKGGVKIIALKINFNEKNILKVYYFNQPPATGFFLISASMILASQSLLRFRSVFSLGLSFRPENKLNQNSRFLNIDKLVSMEIIAALFRKNPTNMSPTKRIKVIYMLN